MVTMQGDTYYTGMEIVQEFSEIGGKKCLKLMGFPKKSDIFLNDIGHNFEISGWILITKTNFMCQIFLEVMHRTKK